MTDMRRPRPSPRPKSPAAPPPPRAAPPPPRARTRRLPFDPTSWSGAIVLMVVFAAVLWAVQIANAADGQRLDRFGIRARAVDGLWGVLTAPFLHASWDHVLSNTLPVILIGWVVLIGGWREWLVVTGVVIVLGGLLTWLIAPSHAVVVGASGLVFGWLAYLVARAWFSRRLKWIVVAVVVLAFFGGLLSGLVPVPHSQVSWQAHVAGFVAGVVAGALLHTPWAARALTRRSAVS